MEHEMADDQTIKGIGQYLQLVGDHYHERYERYWSQINSCSNIASVLTLDGVFHYFGKMARSIFPPKMRDECYSEIIQLKTLEVVLSQSEEELARSMGKLLQKAGDAVNAEFLQQSTPNGEKYHKGLCLVLQCLELVAKLSEYIWAEYNTCKSLLSFCIYCNVKRCFLLIMFETLKESLKCSVICIDLFLTFLIIDYIRGTLQKQMPDKRSKYSNLRNPIDGTCFLKQGHVDSSVRVRVREVWNKPDNQIQTTQQQQCMEKHKRRTREPRHMVKMGVNTVQVYVCNKTRKRLTPPRVLHVSNKCVTLSVWNNNENVI